MDAKELKPGVYKLTKELDNPKPDRRSKEWLKQAKIPTGIYIVRPWSRIAPDDSYEIVRMGEPDYNHIRDPGENRGKEWTDAREAALWDTVVAHLEPADMNAHRFLRLHHIDTYYCDDILEELVKAGKITLDDILTAHRTFMDRPEEE
jgi:hypothetical protein